MSVRARTRKGVGDVPWFRVDDSFPTHPKVEYLEALPWQRMTAATHSWLWAGTWCQRELREKRAVIAGRVPVVRLAKITGLPRKVAIQAADDLVASGLWERTESGDYQFHDFRQYNPDLAAKRSQAGSKGAAKRWQADSNLPSGSQEAATPSDGNLDGNDMASTRVRAHARRAIPDPVPDPNSRDQSGGGGTSSGVAAGEALRETATPPRTVAAFSEPTLIRTPQRLAFLAYEGALSKAGGIIESEGNFGPDFAAVGRLAEKYAAAHRRRVDQVLDEWSLEYMRAKDQRRPDWWVEWCTARAAMGPRGGGLPSTDPLAAEQVRLDKAIDNAMQLGRHDEVERLRKKRDDIAAQRRKAAAAAGGP